MQSSFAKPTSGGGGGGWGGTGGAAIGERTGGGGRAKKTAGDMRSRHPGHRGTATAHPRSAYFSSRSS